MKVIKQTIIKWKDTLLSIEKGGELSMEAPSLGGIPASLSSTASRLKKEGVSYDIKIKEGELIIKRLS